MRESYPGLFIHKFSYRLLANILVNSPGTESVPLFEDLFDLLKTPPNSFRVHKEHMDECREVEGTEDEVGFPCDCVETRGDGICKGEVKEPIARLKK